MLDSNTTDEKNKAENVPDNQQEYKIGNLIDNMFMMRALADEQRRVQNEQQDYENAIAQLKDLTVAEEVKIQELHADIAKIIKETDIMFQTAFQKAGEVNYQTLLDKIKLQEELGESDIKILTCIKLTETLDNDRISNLLHLAILQNKPKVFRSLLRNGVADLEVSNILLNLLARQTNLLHVIDEELTYLSQSLQNMFKEEDTRMSKAIEGALPLEHYDSKHPKIAIAYYLCMRHAILRNDFKAVEYLNSLQVPFDVELLAKVRGETNSFLTQVQKANQNFIDKLKNGQSKTLNTEDFSKLNFSIMNEFGGTVVHAAVLYNQLSTLKKLMQGKFDPNIRDNKGKTILHYAVQSGRVDIVQEILKYGVDVNAKDSEGMTALHIAAVNNSIGIANLLVQAGTNIQIKDNNGKTAFEHNIEMKDNLARLVAANIKAQYMMGIFITSLIVSIFGFAAACKFTKFGDMVKQYIPKSVIGINMSNIKNTFMGKTTKDFTLFR